MISRPAQLGNSNCSLDPDVILWERRRSAPSRPFDGMESTGFERGQTWEHFGLVTGNRSLDIVDPKDENRLFVACWSPYGPTRAWRFSIREWGKTFQKFCIRTRIPGAKSCACIRSGYSQIVYASLWAGGQGREGAWQGPRRVCSNPSRGHMGAN